MSEPEPTSSVRLADQRSASAVLHGILADGVAEFPDDLESAGLPRDGIAFRKGYAEALPRFEAARLASPARAAIAHHLARALEDHVVWQDATGSRPLATLLAEPGVPLPLTVHEFRGAAGWAPSLVYRGTRWDGQQLGELGEELVSRGVVTAESAEALRWVADAALDRGQLHLNGRRIAVLGGGAEMAPTRFWLEAGADVLWLDTVAPPADWLQSSTMAGRLFWPAGNTDLLTQPQEILATLLAFSDGTPLDLGLYAYAPGQARELRLTGVMNALVDALPPALVASVTILVSPTTPTSLSPGDLHAMRARRDARPAWETLLGGVGLLGRGDGSTRSGNAAASRTVVSIQGASYQAAQYIGKVMKAECWAAQAAANGSGPRVSANTAAITRTRSLNHPVFAAAFGGASAFGVETLTPRQSRPLNGLLAVHDWLHPEVPVPGRIRVHGGIHTLPYPLENALRVAAAIGFARSPGLLRGLLQR